MNNVIKEILDFKENADYKRLSCDEIAILRDYITNLQQEEERILNVNEQLVKECQEFETTIYKAVEYIEEHKTKITKTQANNFNEDRQDKPKLKVGTFMWNVDELEDILRGNNDI